MMHICSKAANVGKALPAKIGYHMLSNVHEVDESHSTGNDPLSIFAQNDRKHLGSKGLVNLYPASILSTTKLSTYYSG